MPKTNLQQYDRRKQLSAVERRSHVARMYLDGESVLQIAGELQCSASTVYSDLKRIQDAWVQSAIADFDKRIAIELARVDRIEMKAAEAFEESREPEVITNAKTRRIGNKEMNIAGRALRGVSVTVKDEIGQDMEVIRRPGDPRYLRIMLDCSEKRMKILKLPYLEALLSIQTGQTEDGVEEGTPANSERTGIDRLAGAIQDIAGRLGLEPIAGVAGSIPRAEPRVALHVPPNGEDSVAG